VRFVTAQVSGTPKLVRLQTAPTSEIFLPGYFVDLQQTAPTFNYAQSEALPPPSAVPDHAISGRAGEIRAQC